LDPLRPNYKEPSVEEEIDLREYIEVLLKRWPWIIGLSLVAAVAAFVVSSFLPPVYEAEAKVIMLKSKTDISFVPTIRSENTEQDVNVTEAQRTLLDLVQSSDVAAAVLNESEDLLALEKRNILDLLEKVEATNNGNVISIKVTDEDPLVAAQLADHWAQAYESYINQLFNDRSTVLLGQVEAQVADVENQYRLAQANLEDFLGDNRTLVLQHDIESLKQNLDVKYKLLAQKYGELNRIETWLEDARTVQDQLKVTSSSPGAGIGDMLAVTGLRGQGSLQTTPLQLQLNLADIEANLATPDDAATMIEVIEARKARVEADIEALSAELVLAEDSLSSSAGSEQAQPPNDLAERISALEAALEAQQAQDRELRAARNIAWDNYEAVQRKLAEVTLATQITDSEVRFASHAIIPDDPISPRRLLNTVIGGALGFMLAVVGAFAVEYWQGSAPAAEQTETVPRDHVMPAP
jgi:succinoglycan biosynthesis transport protein ExoP